ncbi:hypothetical protein HDU76_008408 [Blyttiomyces sp. JEL0837]|nr:hypothetical protein HDU76_008408 [Blyttiomyces sp. JEL0837]
MTTLCTLALAVGFLPTSVRAMGVFFPPGTTVATPTDGVDLTDIDVYYMNCMQTSGANQFRPYTFSTSSDMTPAKCTAVCLTRSIQAYNETTEPDGLYFLLQYHNNVDVPRPLAFKTSCDCIFHGVDPDQDADYDMVDAAADGDPANGRQCDRRCYDRWSCGSNDGLSAAIYKVEVGQPAQNLGVFVTSTESTSTSTSTSSAIVGPRIRASLLSSTTSPTKKPPHIHSVETSTGARVDFGIQSSTTTSSSGRIVASINGSSSRNGQSLQGGGGDGGNFGPTPTTNSPTFESASLTNNGPGPTGNGDGGRGGNGGGGGGTGPSGNGGGGNGPSGLGGGGNGPSDVIVQSSQSVMVSTSLSAIVDQNGNTLGFTSVISSQTTTILFTTTKPPVSPSLPPHDPDPSPNAGSGMSVGMVAGVVVGLVILLVAIAVAVFWYRRRLIKTKGSSIDDAVTGYNGYETNDGGNGDYVEDERLEGVGALWWKEVGAARAGVKVLGKSAGRRSAFGTSSSRKGNMFNRNAGRGLASLGSEMGRQGDNQNDIEESDASAASDAADNVQIPSRAGSPKFFKQSLPLASSASVNISPKSSQTSSVMASSGIPSVSTSVSASMSSSVSANPFADANAIPTPVHTSVSVSIPVATSSPPPPQLPRPLRVPIVTGSARSSLERGRTSMDTYVSRGRTSGDGFGFRSGPGRVSMDGNSAVSDGTDGDLTMSTTPTPGGVRFFGLRVRGGGNHNNNNGSVDGESDLSTTPTGTPVFRSLAFFGKSASVKTNNSGGSTHGTVKAVSPTPTSSSVITTILPPPATSNTIPVNMAQQSQTPTQMSEVHREDASSKSLLGGLGLRLATANPAAFAALMVPEATPGSETDDPFFPMGDSASMRSYLTGAPSASHRGHHRRAAGDRRLSSPSPVASTQQSYSNSVLSSQASSGSLNSNTSSQQSQQPSNLSGSSHHHHHRRRHSSNAHQGYESSALSTSSSSNSSRPISALSYDDMSHLDLDGNPYPEGSLRSRTDSMSSFAHGQNLTHRIVNHHHVAGNPFVNGGSGGNDSVMSSNASGYSNPFLSSWDPPVAGGGGDDEEEDEETYSFGM